MESPEELTAKLLELCAPGVRERLVARGLARGLIWSGGILPEGSPEFSSLLSNDLLSHGYTVLGCAIRLRALSLEREIPDRSVLTEAFRTAAECIEAVVRRGERANDRGFHLTVAAAAFHLGQYGARSYSLLTEDQSELNLVSVERLLVALMQRRLDVLQDLCLSWLNDGQNTDEGIVELIKAEDSPFAADDAAYVAVSRVYHRAIANFEYALWTGEEELYGSAMWMLEACVEAAAELKHVPLWWITVLTRHLIDDLWDRSLHKRLPETPGGGGSWPELRRNFIELVAQRQLAEVDLWPSQLEAAQRVVDEGDSLVVALPTSSGKTRIAELCILRCLAGGRRVVYVTPLRALSAQVETTLSRTFKPLGFSVSTVYGASGIGASDIETMKSASIVVATPEKLDFAVRQDSEVIDDVGLIVLDEGHMIGLSEREIRYEVLVQRLLRRTDARGRRIVCLSAIFTEGDAFDAFTSWIRSDNEGEAIRSQWRPTRQRPATIEWREARGWLEYRVQGEAVFVPRFVEQAPPTGRRRNPYPQDQQELVAATASRFREEGHSVLLYCPMRKSVEPTAKAVLKLINQGYVKSFLREDAKEAIQAALRIGEEWLGQDHVAMKALRQGIAVHHAQLPRPFLAELEGLLRSRTLTMAISSPTLAQGVDLSFSVLVFTSLWRNGGLIPPKEFANVIGRVGRAHVDLDGIFVLPVYNSDPEIRKNRLEEFRGLVEKAHGRELESGLYLLIQVCLWRLQEKLGIADMDMCEYVLNQQVVIDKLTEGDDEHAEQLELILAEMDAGILALVEDLECDASEVAAKLDEALQSSLWRRRLKARELQEQSNQEAMLHGRARHVWSRTNGSQRKGFFAASIGAESGLRIVEQQDALRELLQRASAAIDVGEVEQLTEAAIGLASRLFEIHPFQPKIPKNWNAETWQTVLTVWISGVAIADTIDPVGIAFVQEALVYHLVWAIEAVRVILCALEDSQELADEMDEQTSVAVCMTYGVPYLPAARMLEGGMESRVLAVRLTKELGLTFKDRDGLREWVRAVREVEPLEFSENERASWWKFLQRNDYSYETWSRHELVIDPEFAELRVEGGQAIRLIQGDDDSAEVYSVEYERLGVCRFEVQDEKPLTGRLTDDGQIRIERFGPLRMPKWLQELLEGR